MSQSIFSTALLMLAVTQTCELQWPNCRGVKPGFDFETYDFPDCGCDVTFLEISCRASGPSQPIRVTIQCDSPGTNFSAIPNTDLSMMNFTLNELALTSCELPSTFASLLARFGQADTVLSEIRLARMRGELQREHVQDLRAVRTIVITDAANQTRIPFDVIDALPELEEFHLIRSAHLQLVTSGGDDAIHTALHSLKLLSCGITDVPSGAFARFPSLTELYLGGNFIRSFTSDAFRGLKNLEVLSFWGNPLVALTSRSFAFAPRLRRLCLDETRLISIPEDAFEGLQYLELITFKDAKASIKLGSRTFAALPALKELIFKSTSLKPLSNDLLDDSIALEELTIRNAGLETIPKGLFKSQFRLKNLDLSGNKIKTLEADIFHPIMALNMLNLDKNRLEEFPDALFSGLPKLKSVSANNNSLRYIADNAFDSSNLINNLSLNDNHLTSEAFFNLKLSWDMPYLEELHLQGNRLSHMIPDWLRFDRLKKLDLSRNNFTLLKEMHIMFHSSGLEVDLRHNGITNFKMDPIIPGLSETDRYVTHVLLDDNPFQCDCKLYTFITALKWSNHHFISGLKLDPELAQCASPPALAGKLIRNLPLSSLTCSLPLQDCPENCTCNVRPATQSLELDCEAEPSEYPNPESHGQKSTQLRLRSIMSLTIPSHVVSLNLTGLGITEPPSLKALQNIKELDLSRNYLIDVPTGLLKTNITLRLADNPFACDCPHSDNIYVLQNNAAKIVDADNVTCRSGEFLMYLDADKLCEVKKGALIGGCLAAFGLLVAVVAGFAYRFSLEIKVFLFSRGWCQTWVQEDDLDEAQYDAFVSFSQDDAQWVAEQLIPKLEEEPNNFKLCVHYRDWVIGDMIPAQIATSVEQSRRTIVVLTENFLKSKWAALEFRSANSRAQREHHRVLIIVLGEVPDSEEIDAELRAYLSTNTYLKWGDPWFWEKLRYAMPHRRQNVTFST